MPKTQHGDFFNLVALFLRSAIGSLKISVRRNWYSLGICAHKMFQAYV